MKEIVRQPKHSWVAGVAVIVIAIVFFALMGSSKFPEPGSNIEYDMKSFEDLDNIPTDYTELASITPDAQPIRALAVAADKIYVACKDAVVVYGEGDKETARYRIEGSPNCIGVGPDGTMYVGMKNKVAVLDSNGAAKGEWTDFADRSYITAIAANATDVYVADAGKRVVTRFDKEGKAQNKIGEKDAARDVPGLEAPSPYLDLALNPDGELWVVNPGKLGLEQYRSDGSIVTSWYNPSLKLDGFPGCCNPTHIAFDSKGDLITCEKGLVRIKSYEVTAGTFEGLVAGSELFPQEQSVRDLAVDAQDRILVIDPQRKAVRIFIRKESEHGRSSQPA